MVLLFTCFQMVPHLNMGPGFGGLQAHIGRSPLVLRSWLCFLNYPAQLSLALLRVSDLRAACFELVLGLVQLILKVFVPGCLAKRRHGHDGAQGGNK